MDDLKATLSTPIIKNQAGQTVVSLGTLVTAGIGAMALYMMIPAKNRSRIFK